MFLTKLPNVGDSIFTVMTGLANKHAALNLAQGFPDFQPDPALIDLVHQAMQAGHNQYAPMIGLAALREQIAAKTKQHYKQKLHPDKEITITAGATQAIFTAISAFVAPDQEVICFDPAYDAYAPAIKVQGARPIHIPMAFDGQEFHYDWDQLRARINTRTRMVIINNPHNPSGAVLKTADFDRLSTLLQGSDILVLADEVYEHMVFDGVKHQSMLTHEALREKCLVVSSFGKTYHNTGWKIGYIMGDEKLMKEYRKVHQFNVFSVNTPMQAAFAQYLEKDKSYEKLADFYQKKRDLLLKSIAGSRFEWVPTRATYFQLLKFNKISEADDLSFTQQLVQEKGVALIPISPFVQQPPDYSLVRLCFAKNDVTLQQAGELLCKI